MQQQGVDDPPGSRLFVVCGRAVEVRARCLQTGEPPWALLRPVPPCTQEDVLRAAFVPHGNLQNVKLLKEKGGERGAAAVGSRSAQAGGSSTAGLLPLPAAQGAAAGSSGRPH